MKKIIFLLPLAILGICIGAVLFMEGDTLKSEDNSELTPAEKKKVKPVPEAEIMKFVAPIDNYFSVAANNDEKIEFKRLAVYPIMASETYLKDHEEIGEYLNLKEALAKRAVRIVEKGQVNGEREIRSPFISLDPNNGGIMGNEMPVEQQEAGYAYTEGASVNTLVIENNSDEDVYLMAGDVVQGGRQDRVVAEDMIIAANSGAHEVPVFCVESNRWSYKSESPATVNNTKKEPIYAFTGYFNVASNSIRQTVKEEKNQSEVWAEVGHVTAKHGAQSNTNTYSALQNSKSFIKQRDEYLSFFENVFEDSKDVIGVVVVSGDKIVGTDMFATPDMFQKQYKLLLHAYVTDAMTFGDKIGVEKEKINQYFNEKVVSNYFTNQSDETAEKALKFVKNQKVVHFTDFE